MWVLFIIITSKTIASIRYNNIIQCIRVRLDEIKYITTDDLKTKTAKLQFVRK